MDDATSEERSNLAVILGAKVSASAGEIIAALRKAGSNGLVSIARRSHVEYSVIAADVAKKVGVKDPASQADIAATEKRIIEAMIAKALTSAKPEEREKLLARLGGSSVAGVGATAGALAVANLSGFALYTTASTLLGAVTSAVGVALAFGVYTAMSSGLAVITGPFGWLLLGGFAAVKIGGVNYKKTIPAVLAVATLRARLMEETSQALTRLYRKQEGHQRKAKDLSSLELYLQRRSLSKDSDQVPCTEVPLWEL